MLTSDLRGDIMLVTCDYCSNIFKVDVKKERISVNTKECYFTCPSCGKKYHVFYEDRNTSRLMSKINRVAHQEKIPFKNKEQEQKYYENREKHLKRLKRRLKVNVEELEQKGRN